MEPPASRPRWGARLLALQGEDGQWEGGALFPARTAASADGEQPRGQPWTATASSLVALHDFGVDPDDPSVRRAVAQIQSIAAGSTPANRSSAARSSPASTAWSSRSVPTSSRTLTEVVARLLGEQLEDGGWNCEVENGSVRSSFHTTIRVLEGLLAHERASGGSVVIDRGSPPW